MTNPGKRKEMGRHWREQDGSNRHCGEAITSRLGFDRFNTSPPIHTGDLKSFSAEFSSTKAAMARSYPMLAGCVTGPHMGPS